MKKYEWIKQESDAETYLINDTYYKVVWGYSTGSDTGWHNEFDTDVCVYRWTGEECEVDELPGAMDSDWEVVEGFNLELKKNSYGNPEVDWEDYAKKVDEILAEIEKEVKEMKKYYLSPAKFYDHGCMDYAVFEDRGDGTAVCVEVESCTHRIHEIDHQYQKLGEIVDVAELIADRDYLSKEE